MNQADVSKLISQLRIQVKPRHRNLKSPGGPEARLLKLRKTVTGLVKHERIEMNWNRADEARGYAERLIAEAIRYGDCHHSTMEMADYWLLEKQLVHKLFKVLVPRFRECSTSYTRLLRAPQFTGMTYARAVLELRGHPYPPLVIDTTHNRGLLHNVLLDEAAKEYRKQKISEAATALLEKIESEQDNVTLHFKDNDESSIAEHNQNISVSDDGKQGSNIQPTIESKLSKT